MAFVTGLRLDRFRSYESLRIEIPTRPFVLLTGKNGAGKTNLLESVSLLSAGRGLRGARAADLQKRDDQEQGWTISARLETPHGQVQIGTGYDKAQDKRVVRINGEKVRAQSALGDYVSCVWLTPQMDRLFQDSAGTRRRFLDRMVFAFDSGHSGRVTRYDNALRQRAKLLEGGGGDPAWLSSLETQMAQTGMAIAAARVDLARRLNAFMTSCSSLTAPDLFPRAVIHVQGSMEDALAQGGLSALEIEERFRTSLAAARRSGAPSSAGTHRSDLVVTYAEKSMPAAHCSTGEQKALLIGLVLAHARMIAAERGGAPVMLLDEVAAHLDELRRKALFDILQGLGSQIWITGTDIALFEGIVPHSACLCVEQGHVSLEDKETTMGHKTPV